jgi:hypothetical protein
VNGRAAQLGFIAAAISEYSTKQSIWQQLNDPASKSTEIFLAIIVISIVSTFIPRFGAGEQPEDRETGPWTVTAELANGRAAMVGFTLLLVWECIKQQPFF